MRRVLFSLIFFSIVFNAFAQQRSMRSQLPGIDTLVWETVDRLNPPEPLSCEEEEYKYFRLKLDEWQIIEFGRKQLNIPTDKEEWSEEDVARFERSYNEEQAAELRELNNTNRRKIKDIWNVSEEYLGKFIRQEWSGPDFSICRPYCEENYQHCVSTYKFYEIENDSAGHRYQVANTYIEENPTGQLVAEISLNLMVRYSAWIYFDLSCFCDNLPDLVNVEPEDILPPWDKIDLTGERMKTGHPFAMAIERDRGFPWVPVIGGAAGAGVIAALLLDQEDDGGGCDITISSNISTSTCGNSNGSAQVTISPPGIYGYQWSNGATGSMQTGLSPGTYTVTVTDGELSCTSTAQVVIPDEEIDFTVVVGAVGANCGEDNGNAFVNTQSPGNYTYTWSTGSSEPQIDDLPVGQYSVTVTSGPSCTESYNVNVGQLPPAIEIDLMQFPATCGRADGAVTTTLEPAGNYNYLWSNGATSLNLNDVPAGEYELTLTVPGTGCQKIQSVAVGEAPPDFTLGFSSSPASCNGSDGTATVVVSPADNFTYLWSNGSQEAQITGVEAGEYTVTVTLAGTNCTKTGSITIPENPANITISFNTMPADCGQANGVANANVSPPGEYTFLWSDGTTESSNTTLLAGLPETVTVTDQNGCSVSREVQVNELPADYIQMTSVIEANCIGQGGEIVIFYTNDIPKLVEVTITGPAGSVNVTAFSGGEINVSDLINVVPGQWSIVATFVDDSQCIEEILLTVPNISEPLIVQDDIYQTDLSNPVSGNVLDNDQGLNITVFNFTQPAGAMVNVNPNGTFSFSDPAESGDYVFEYYAQDACGKRDTATVTVTVNALPCNFEITLNPQDANCGVSNGAITTTLDPPGSYTFLWSTGANTQDLSGVPAGQYAITVTNLDLGCTQFPTVEIGEVDNTYLADLELMPANCAGGGEILLTIESPGGGPVVLQIVGDETGDTLLLPLGSYALSDSIELPPGMYQLIAYDQGAGQECSETMEITIEESATMPVAVDDQYETNFQTPIMGNMLMNDSGISITLFGINNIIGGSVDFNADGTFTFTPDADFFGTASFTYTIMDACGSLANANVEIEVIEPICDFTATFENTNSDCGLENGSTSVIISPDGNYTYIWSNGEMGSSLENVPGGMYTVTVQNPDLGNCEQIFETEVLQNTIDYISNEMIVPPTCTEGGEIQFELSSPGGGLIEIQVDHPNGMDTFLLAQGPISLSNFISIVPGSYSIFAYDIDIGTECSEVYEIVLDASSGPEITVTDVTPPSAISAMDGSISIILSIPGTAPYTIYLNGEEWGSTPDLTFTIEGLGAGLYSVQVQDAGGCFSNTLMVEVPLPPEPMLTFGFGFMQTDYTNPPAIEHKFEENGQGVYSFVRLGINTSLKSLPMHSEIMLSNIQGSSLLRFSHLYEVWQTNGKMGEVEFRTGIFAELSDDKIQEGFLLNLNAQKELRPEIQMEMRLGMRISQKEFYPEIGVVFNFIPPKILPVKSPR